VGGGGGGGRKGETLGKKKKKKQWVIKKNFFTCKKSCFVFFFGKKITQVGSSPRREWSCKEEWGHEEKGRQRTSAISKTCRYTVRVTFVGKHGPWGRGVKRKN